MFIFPVSFSVIFTPGMFIIRLIFIFFQFTVPIILFCTIGISPVFSSTPGLDLSQTSISSQESINHLSSKAKHPDPSSHYLNQHDKLAFNSSYQLFSQDKRIEHLLIHLKNITEGNSSIPGSNGLIKIERRLFSQEAETLDGMASFYNISTRSNYRITAFHKSNTNAFGEINELWGYWNDFMFQTSTPEITLTRNMPYIWNISSFHARGSAVNPSLEVGEPITFEVLVENPSGKGLESKIVLLLKNLDSGNVHRLEKNFLIKADRKQELVLINFIPHHSGEYHVAPGIFVKQGFNQWADCWDWSEQARFFVIGERRNINFAGYEWEVKSGFGNPGGNLWSSDTNQVWLDERQRLHLTLQNINDRWISSEVISQDTFGYGTYTFYIDADPAAYDPHVVAGIFLYQDERNEIDIEFSRWGDAQNYRFGNYVIQPAEFPGNQFRFPLLTHGTYTTHRIIWKPHEILFSSWHGHYDSPKPDQIIAQWQYAGRHIPVKNGLRLFFNIWLFQGIHPESQNKEKIIINNFTFEPLEVTN